VTIATDDGPSRLKRPFLGSPQIEKKHAEMLETMCTKFKIKSIDKAVRIVVQFAITEGVCCLRPCELPIPQRRLCLRDSASHKRAPR
jgi:hypothetical protein